MYKIFNKKVVVIIAILIVIACSATVYALNSSDNNIFFRIGQAFGTHKTQNKIVMNKNEIQIPKGEIDKIADQYKEMGISNGQEIAIRSIINQEVLYQEATSKGFSIEDSDVWAALNNEREVVSKANNYNEILEILRGAKMTEDEYWNSQFENRKKALIISKYIEPVWKEHNKDKDMSQRTQEDLNKWQDTLDQIVDKLKKEKNITYVIKE